MRLKALISNFAKLNIVLLLAFMGVVNAQAQEFSSTELLQPFSVTAITGEKPQSKVWTYDGYWWAVMPNTSGTVLWRLDGTSWTNRLTLSSYTDTHADVKVVNDVVHILLYRGRNSVLVSLEYVAGNDSYQLWTSRPTPVDVTLDSGVETATIDIDTSGRMWLASDAVSDINVRWSDAPYSAWSAAINIANNVSSDDISAITAFGGKIGVLWSNQNTQRFGFKYHIDGANPSTWSSDEVPASQSALNIGAGMADDHLNMAVATDGTIYAAVKTSYDTPGYPKISLLIRRPNGAWDDLYGLDDSGTRGIALLNEYKRTITVVYTASEGQNNLVYRQSYLSPISFGLRKTIISGSINDATSTKDSYSDQVVVLASDGSSAYGVKAFSGLGYLDSLSGYWAMNEGSGSILYDSSSYHNNGTVFGNPEWHSGIRGLALQLNGDSQYAVVPDNPQFDIANMITLAAWIKPDSRGNQQIICKTDGASGFELSLEGSSPYRIVLRLDGIDIIYSTSAYPINGDWMHIAATWDGGIARMYINGEEESSLIYSDPIGINSVDVRIGFKPEVGEYFSGLIDETYIYRRALSSSEIQTISTRPAIQYSIFASAGANGTITPSGTIQVIEGNDQAFSISANSGFHIEDVLIDGISVGPVANYTFNDVTADHTITASFSMDSTMMAAHWAMDEGSGSTLFDSSGNGNSASIIGSPSWIAGRYGMALQFSGSQYAMAADNSSLDLTQNMTLTAWVKPVSSTNQSIIKKAITSGVPVDGYELSLGAAGSSSNQVAYVRINQATGGDSYKVSAISSYPINGNSWMHVAATYDGSELAIYINGILENNISASIPINTNNLALGLGAQSDGTSRFSGGLDDIRIYNYALSASEINALAGINHLPNSPVLVFPPDQSIGISGSPALSVLISDPDLDILSAAFWGRTQQQEFQLIGTASNLPSGSVASVIWTNLQPAKSYEWYAVVNDDSSSRTGQVWSFTTADVLHTITAACDTNGSINPAGSILVSHNGSQTFDFTPDYGFHISDILVDGVSEGTSETYTFSNVTADHSIYAAFEINSYIISASADSNGTIFPSGEISLFYGTDTVFTFTPDFGYHVKDIFIDSVSIGAVTQYTFTDISANHSIHAAFDADTFTITSSAGQNGTIDPSGQVFARTGSQVGFSITPDTEYHISDVIVDSVSLGPLPNYVFDNVLSDHTISATFAINVYTILATAGNHGSISPEGIVYANAGSDHTFTITPLTGYHVDEVFVDSVAMGPLLSYTFYSISGNHQISATFALNTYTIGATAGAGGSIAPSGDISVNYGQNQSFEIIAYSGYFINNVIVDSIPNGPIENYTFNYVADNHVIHAEFTHGIAPVIVSSPQLLGDVGEQYSYATVATGVPAPIFHLLEYPTQMTIDTLSGLVVWIPVETGIFNVSIEARNLAGADTQTFHIDVRDCSYVAGDINNNGVVNGLDVIYGVNYFKGGIVPPYSCDCNGHVWYVAGDVNASCSFNGLDITFFVSFLKGGAALLYCAGCVPGEMKFKSPILAPIEGSRK